MRKRKQPVQIVSSDTRQSRGARKFFEEHQRLKQQNFESACENLLHANVDLQNDAIAERCLPKQARQTVQICMFKDVHFQIGG